MSDSKPRSEEIAASLVKYIDPYLQQQTQAAVNSMAAQKSEFENAIQSSSDDLARRFHAGIKKLSEDASKSIEQAGQYSVKLIEDAISRLSEATKVADKAAESARKESDLLVQRKADADAAEKSASEERIKAEKASATLAMQSQIMVERLTKEASIEQRRIERQARRKAEEEAFQAEEEALRSEEEALQDEYDTKESRIQFQIREYVPEVMEVVDGLVSNGDFEEREDDTNGSR